MRCRMGLIATTTALILTIPTAALTQGEQRARAIDGRDALLAALGSLTLECLGRVGPFDYGAESGTLKRTFEGCRSRNSDALKHIDALLGVQMSAQGRADDLAGHYTSRWNVFVASFPFDRISDCPTWRLLNVIDAPTFTRVEQFIDRDPTDAIPPRVGKENYRYRVSSAQCGTDGACAVRQAAACAGGFGPNFIVELDPGRSRIEVDPEWWLTNYTYPSDADNPFKQKPSRGSSYYHPTCHQSDPPGSLYGSIERAGEPCCRWSETLQQWYYDRILTPIDCTDGDGWYCMTYCMKGPASVFDSQVEESQALRFLFK